MDGGADPHNGGSNSGSSNKDFSNDGSSSNRNNQLHHRVEILFILFSGLLILFAKRFVDYGYLVKDEDIAGMVYDYLAKRFVDYDYNSSCMGASAFRMFLLWYSITKAICVAFAITFFPVFDVPVFCPILLFYWIVLFGLTMKRQILHMIKFKYVPFNIGKQTYVGKKASPSNTLSRD